MYRSTLLNKLACIAMLFMLSQTAFAGQPFSNKVILQLRWQHQFQFAGYYAALHKGFYQEAGLEVTLKEGGPDISSTDEVIQGHADFGVSTSGLLKAYLDGKPVLMLAPIFQHSPLVLLSLGDKLSNPTDIAKAGFISLQPGDESLEIKAMFVNEGVPLNKLKITDERRGLKDLVAGNIVAMNAYISNEPFWLQQQGIRFNFIKPEHYGMDFYSDVLFTSRDIEKTKPKVVADFLAASLKGWEYALTHHDEIIDLILANYNSQGKSREHLAFEAKKITELISPELIQIGHSNPGRWRHIANTFANFNLLAADLNLEKFFYQPERKADLTWFYIYLAIAMSVTGITFSITIYILRINKRLSNSLEALNNAQLTLADKEKLYRLLVENMRDVVWIQDAVSLHFRYISPSVKQLSGYTSDEIMAEPQNNNLWSLYDTAHKKKIPEEIAEFLSGKNSGLVYRNEIELPCKDGTTVWTEVLTKYYLNEHTGQVELQGVTRDIADRKKKDDALRESEMRFRTLYETTSDAVMLLNDGKFFDCNQAALTMFSCPCKEDFYSKSPAALSPAKQACGTDSTTLAENKIALAKDQGSTLFEWLHLRIDSNETFPAEVLLSAVEFNGKSIIQANVRDITERKLLEARNNLLIAALEAAANGIVITDKAATVIWANSSFSRLTGYSLAEAVGNKPNQLFKSGIQNHSFYVDMWVDILSGRNWRGELINKRKDGSLYHEELSIAPVKNSTGDITHFIGIKVDISDRKAMESQLQNLASTDPLTGLFNRREFYQRLKQEIAKVARLSNYSAVLLMLDLDFFKRINDTYGHATGDAVLIAFANIIRNNSRTIDIPARLGGEEFAILLTGSDHNNAQLMAERLREQVAETTINHQLGRVQVTVSIGAALVLADDFNDETVMHRADMALYEAKEKGRNQTCWFFP